MSDIIISDLHLGAESCRDKAIESFLADLPERTKRLILNGDVLENTERRLTKSHWRILSKLRKLSERLEYGVYWVRGNHDHDANAVAHLIGADFVQEFLIESGDKKILCVHGDAWDDFITTHPVITRVCDWCYLWMQRVSRKMALSAKRSSKTFLRCAQKVTHGAVEYAKVKGADAVICGHTHHAEQYVIARPHYFNSGCWTDIHCHFITVDDGCVTLREVNL